MNLGPDGARYWHAAGGGQVPQPFHLRWLLPRTCGQIIDRWWFAWFAGWPLAAGGMFAWRLAAGDGWQIAAAACLFLLALPGFLGPTVTIPVGVDIPATGLALCGVALCEAGLMPLGVGVIVIASCVRETVPVWSALWLWSPWPLVALIAPLVAHLAIKRGPDPLGGKFQDIADHPIRSALESHRGRWRDARLMVAPWGICLAALVDPGWPLALVLALAYAQLLVATDTVRLLHHAAGPALAVGAAQTIPVAWLPLACAVHVVWWFNPERV